MQRREEEEPTEGGAREEQRRKASLQLLKKKKKQQQQPQTQTQPPTQVQETSQEKEPEDAVQQPLPREEEEVDEEVVRVPEEEQEGVVDTAEAVRSRTRRVVVWTCQECGRECIPVREESRCLCGHRLKEHDKSGRAFPCKRRGCECAAFFFVVAEGAWILRCRCKHRHTDHEPGPGAHPCKKRDKCRCEGFDSPWVCNCDHPWAAHVQTIEERDMLHHVANLSDATHQAVQRGPGTLRGSAV